MSYGCGVKQDVANARAAVTDFHSHLDGQQYTAIYAKTDPRFREVTKADDFETLLTAIHNKLGTVQNATQRGYFVNFNTSGTQIRMTYDTQFTTGKAQEEFLWSKKDGEFDLLAYHINSNALIAK